MAISESGALSLSDIADEFGGSTPHALNEYYAGGDNVAAGTEDGDGNAIPSSGTISISHFYDTSAVPPPVFYGARGIGQFGGYVGGSSWASGTVNYWSLASATGTTASVASITAGGERGGASNGTYVAVLGGYYRSGSSAIRSATSRYIAMASAGSASWSNPGDIYTPVGNAACGSNGTIVLHIGGYSQSSTAYIETIGQKTWASITANTNTFTSFGDLGVVYSGGGTGVSHTTYLIAVCGNQDGTYGVTTGRYVTMANANAAVIVNSSTAHTGRGDGGSASGIHSGDTPTHGYVACGYRPAPASTGTNAIDVWAIASQGNGTNWGSAQLASWDRSACGSGTRATVQGGNDGGQSNAMDSWPTTSTSGSSTNFGTLSFSPRSSGSSSGNAS